MLRRNKGPLLSFQSQGLALGAAVTTHPAWRTLHLAMIRAQVINLDRLSSSAKFRREHGPDHALVWSAHIC